MRLNPMSEVYKTYKFKMTIFENGSNKELIQFMTNTEQAIKGTGATKLAGRINFLHTLLHVESLRELDNLVIQNKGTTDAHFKETQEGLLEFFPPTT